MDEPLRGGGDAMQLLLAVASPWRPADRAPRIVEAARGVRDWEAVIDLAAWHRVVPFVSRQLSAHGAGAVAASTIERLRGSAREIAARALGSARELVRVLAAFGADGVRSLPYKGPALALAAYGDAGLRDSADLDFVVAPCDVDRARGVLRDLGYRPREGMSRAQEGAVYGGQGHFPYVRDGRLAELHWRFAATRFPWNPALTPILDRATTVELAGARITVPSAQDHVLLLALHGTRHVWAELEWVLSLAELLRKDRPDGASLLAEATAIGGRRALLVGLEVARRALGAPVPDLLVAAAAGDATVELLVGESLSCLMGGTADSPLRRHNARAFYLRCLERQADRVRFVVQSTLRPTPREWEAVRLPGMLAPLYVPVRLGRLLLRR